MRVEPDRRARTFVQHTQAQFRVPIAAEWAGFGVLSQQLTTPSTLQSGFRFQFCRNLSWYAAGKRGGIAPASAICLFNRTAPA